MIAFIGICYSLLYIVLFNKLKLLPKTAGAISAFAGVGVVLIGAVVFAWYAFAPMSPDARLYRYIVPIVSNVKGLIIEVNVEANTPMPKGDPLYRIDPAPYEFKVRQLKATIKQLEATRTLADLQVERATQLLKSQAAARVDLDRWKAEQDAAIAAIANTQAQLENAEWELEQTVVRAPSDGYALNVAIRPGSFAGTVGLAANVPFVTTDTNEVVASFSQSAIRNIQEDDPVEYTFTNKPGQIFSGKVYKVIASSPSAQLMASGQLQSISGAAVDRWVVRVAPDDVDLARTLSQGAAGTMAVYTQRGKPVHIISRVALRINAWLSYLTSP